MLIEESQRNGDWDSIFCRIRRPRGSQIAGSQPSPGLYTVMAEATPAVFSAEILLID